MKSYTAKDIAQMVKDAARVREESYDEAAADIEEKTKEYPNFSQFYRKTLREATTEVNEEIGELLFLALDGWWNDSLDWADRTLKNSP